MPRVMAMPWWTSGCSCQTWFGEDYAERRHKCQVPEELRFTKPQLAAEMVKAIRGEGRLPFKYVAADCLYGTAPDFSTYQGLCRGDVVGVGSLGCPVLVSAPGHGKPISTKAPYVRNVW